MDTDTDTRVNVRTGERRELGRLEDDGAAARERWPELPAEHHYRVVPLRAFTILY